MPAPIVEIGQKNLLGDARQCNHLETLSVRDSAVGGYLTAGTLTGINWGWGRKRLHKWLDRGWGFSDLRLSNEASYLRPSSSGTLAKSPGVKGVHSLGLAHRYGGKGVPKSKNWLIRRFCCTLRIDTRSRVHYGNRLSNRRIGARIDRDGRLPNNMRGKGVGVYKNYVSIRGITTLSRFLDKIQRYRRQPWAIIEIRGVIPNQRCDFRQSHVKRNARAYRIENVLYVNCRDTQSRHRLVLPVVQNRDAARTIDQWCA